MNAPTDTSTSREADAPARDEDLLAHELSLPVYSGPLDLLLYLIDREEIDIFEIPVAEVLEQYLAHLQCMKEIDVNLAGEFLVLAARLMEIKSRWLLPLPEDEETEGEAEDPRLDLVRQLLEYRKVKEAAKGLADARILHGRRFARLYRHKFAEVAEVEEEPEDERSLGLENVGIFDIFNFFDQVMRQTLANAPVELTLDEVTIEERVDQILERLRLEPRLSFRQLTGENPTRMEVVGYFQALLEVTRRKLTHVLQPSDFAQIELRARTDTSDEAVLDLVASVKRERPDLFQPVAAGLPDPSRKPAGGAEGGPGEADGEKLPPWKRKRRMHFKAMTQEEELEHLSEEDAKILDRIENVMARARAASELFEASKGGTIRDPAQLEGDGAQDRKALVRAAAREADATRTILFRWRKRMAPIRARPPRPFARRR